MVDPMVMVDPIIDPMVDLPTISYEFELEHWNARVDLQGNTALLVLWRTESHEPPATKLCS